MIKAIIFDLGRVIIPFDFERGYLELSRISQLDTPTIRERIRGTGLVPRFESGLVEAEPFVSGIAEALGIPLSMEEFSRIWNSIFLNETLISEELLLELKKHYRVLLLSNTNSIHFEGLEKAYPVLRHFEHQILSFRVQAMKPEARIYLHAAELAGCETEECVFVDDLEENVVGARQVGMQALVFTGQVQLERDFEDLGIVFR